MSGAGGVVALVMLEWTTGWLATAAWTQSWGAIRRGHFRIMAWVAVILATLTMLALRTVADDAATSLAVALVAATVLYLGVQYSRTDLPGVIVGAVAAAIGVVACIALASDVDAWSGVLVVAHLVAGAALLGSVTNGMMLGHWYLNQPGLQSWALARLTSLALVATATAAVVGLLDTRLLIDASTSGAVLGLPGFGESFGAIFFGIWVAFIAFTGAVVWGARRCVQIRSIQSATGLYYVALLTAGIAEFLVRYLMVNA